MSSFEEESFYSLGEVVGSTKDIRTQLLDSLNHDSAAAEFPAVHDSTLTLFIQDELRDMNFEVILVRSAGLGSELIARLKNLENGTIATLHVPYNDAMPTKIELYDFVSNT